MEIIIDEARKYIISGTPVYEGYCSRLYKGIDTRFNQRYVAVKIVDKPEGVRDMSDLETEITVCCRMGDLTSRVPQIFDYKKEKNRFIIIMQWIEGENLSERIVQPQCKDWEKLRYAKELCEILSVLHRHKNHYQHRDLKPDNIRIGNDGHVYLMDFGITAVDRHIGEGTNAYRPPENDEIYATIGHRRIDVFQLGIIFYEMFTGHRPEPVIDYSADYGDRKWAEFKEPAAIRADIPDSLNQIIVKCMKLDPNDRYYDAGKVLDDLRKVRL